MIQVTGWELHESRDFLAFCSHGWSPINFCGINVAIERDKQQMVWLWCYWGDLISYLEYCMSQFEREHEGIPKDQGMKTLEIQYEK